MKKIQLKKKEDALKKQKEDEEARQKQLEEERRQKELEEQKRKQEEIERKRKEEMLDRPAPSPNILALQGPAQSISWYVCITTCTTSSFHIVSASWNRAILPNVPSLKALKLCKTPHSP